MRIFIASTSVFNYRISPSFRDIDRSQWSATVRKARRHRRKITSATEFKVNEYHNYDSIVDYLNKVGEEYPSLSEKFEFGDTFEGRKLIGIKIGSSVRKHKPAVFIDAGIHSRKFQCRINRKLCLLILGEWIAPATALFLIDKVSTKFWTLQ